MFELIRNSVTRRQLARGGRLGSLVIVLAGCSASTPPQRAPADCGFPADTRLAFAGEAALSQLGLAKPGLGDQVGMIYVTADVVRVSPDRPARRAYCLVPEAGANFGSQVGELPRDWVLPDPLPPLARPPVRQPQPQVMDCNGGTPAPPPSAADWPGWLLVGAMRSGGHDELQLAAFAGGVVAIQTPWTSCEATARENDVEFISNTAYWLSADGRSWEALSLADAFGAPVRIATLYEAADGELVAISAAEWDQESEGDLPSQAWRSADGRAWEPIGDWSAPPGWVLRGAERWLLVPTFLEPQAGEVAVWESPDGYAWRQRAIDLPEGRRPPASASAAAAGDGGFAILDCPRDWLTGWGGCRMLASEDGEAWDLSDPLPGWWWSVTSHDGEWRAVAWDRADPKSAEGHVLGVWGSDDALHWELLAELPMTPWQRGDGTSVLGASFLSAGADLMLAQLDEVSGKPGWSSADGGVTWEQDGPRLNTLLASVTYDGVTTFAATMNDGPIVFWLREK